MAGGNVRFHRKLIGSAYELFLYPEHKRVWKGGLNSEEVSSIIHIGHGRKEADALMAAVSDQWIALGQGDAATLKTAINNRVSDLGYTGPGGAAIITVPPGYEFLVGSAATASEGTGVLSLALAWSASGNAASAGTGALTIIGQTDTYVDTYTDIY